MKTDKRYNKIIGKKAIVEIKNNFTFTGTIQLVTDKFLGIKNNSNYYIIPIDNIFIIEILSG